MTACDPFRIALEQRAHGALGDPEALALDAHLSTCSACQAYAAEARALEAVMGAAAAESMQQMDWTVVERAISGWRRRSRLVIGVAVGFALYTLAPLVLSLARVPGRPERNLPALGVIASLSLGFLALAVASAARLRREARLTAQGDQAALLAVLREDLARRIRALRLARWLLLAYGAFALATPLLEQARSPEMIAGVGLAALAGLGGALWIFRVRLPRLEREQRALAPEPELPA